MLSLAGLAQVVARARRVEFACFEGIGRRAPGADAAVVAFLSGASQAHGYRAGLLEACQPVASGFDDAFTRFADAKVTAMIEAICADGEGRAMADALVEAFYPALRDAYDRLTLYVDGPGGTFARRTFRRCRDDVSGVLEEARAIGGTDAWGLRVRQVRALIEQAGGVFGSLEK